MNDPVYRIEEAYYDHEGRCYRVDESYDHAAWLVDHEADCMALPEEDAYPYHSHEEAAEALRVLGWQSDDGIVFRKRDYPAVGMSAVALVVLAGMEHRETVSASEASAILGINKQRVCKLCASGALVAKKWANAWMIDRESVEARAANPPKSGRRWR